MSTDEETAEFQDLSDVDEVWISGSDAVTGEQFIKSLDAVMEIQDFLDQVSKELAELDTGLDRADTIRLLKGRNMGWALDDIEGFFDAVDDVIASDPQEIAPRLIQSKVSDMTIAEAAELFDDLVRLAEKYGSLNEQTENDDE